jgi:hypothetical protein
MLRSNIDRRRPSRFELCAHDGVKIMGTARSRVDKQGLYLLPAK